MSSILEQKVRLVWKAAPYGYFGRCATCGCTHDEHDRPLLVRGVNTSSLVCFACFDEEHGGKHPNYRRRRRGGIAIGLAVGLLAGGLAFSGFGGGTAGALRAPSAIPSAVQYRNAADVKYECPTSSEADAASPACPQDDTWYQGGKLVVPTGTWRISYRLAAYSARHSHDPGTVSAFTTLSTRPDAATDEEFTAVTRSGGNLFRMIATHTASKIVTVPRPTTFYLLLSQSEGAGWDKLHFLGSFSPTVIRAERLG